MHYEGNIIRPPSESNSILLQITVGCSRNKCTFCGAYNGEQFKIKSDKIIMEDIKFASQYCRRQKRVFLCDGDALIVPQKRLIRIMSKIQDELPWVERVGLYANAKSLKMKTVTELIELKKHGLEIAYVGVETGDDETLKKINKGTTSNQIVELCQKVKSSGIKLSLTVLLGISGRERSLIHATATGEILSNIDPEYIGALSLMLVPGTPIYNEYKANKFTLIDPNEMLIELRTMIEKTNLSNGLFHANHASNYLSIRANLPKDKAATLRIINKALLNNTNLKPEWLRAL